MVYEQVAASSSGEPIKIRYEKDKRSGSYAAFARVTQQLREEYLEGRFITTLRSNNNRITKIVHRRAAHISISYDDMEDWFADFQHPVKSIQIRTSQQDLRYEHYVELLPLLRLKARVTVELASRFVNVDREPAWRYYVDADSIGRRIWERLPTDVASLNKLLALDNAAWLDILRDEDSTLASVEFKIITSTLKLYFRRRCSFSDPTSGQTPPSHLNTIGLNTPGFDVQQLFQHVKILHIP